MNSYWKAEAKATEFSDQPAVWEREEINAGHENSQTRHATRARDHDCKRAVRGVT